MEFTEPVMRPPQEARSLLLRATQGCTYNQCHFCYVSRGYPFGAVSLEHLEEEALLQKPLFSADAPIYLTGSNPFALPTATLKGYMEVLRTHFPRCAEISMQSRIDDIARKNLAELGELRGLGLTHLYIGTENGHDGALKLMNKGYTSGEAVEQLLRLDEAGIAYTLYYIIGMGGRGMGRVSGAATAALFNQVHPRRVTTTGMTVFPGTPLAEMTKSGAFLEATEREKIEELLVFLENLSVDTAFDAVHYLNALNYRFSVADRRERERVLDDIRDVLRTHSDEELELMAGRHLITSL